MLPLTGMKVIDVTTNISGPTVTMILADLGAEVIKIERPGKGDDARKMAPIVKEDGTYFLNINRNKKSVVLNLALDEAREVLYELIKDADIFVENFRLGKADKLGLSYNKLKSINEKLIYCSLSAYGQNGPDRLKPGYDAILQAETGIMSMTGSSELARVPVSLLDQGSAVWGALGIVTALLQRTQTGKGQKVATSLFETGVFWSGYHLLSTMLTGENPQKLGSNHGSFAPYGAFHTKDVPIMIGISNDRLFEKLCHVLQMSDWILSGKYGTNGDRVKNRLQLNEAIQTLLLEQDAASWLSQLENAGVPSAKVQTMEDMITSPQLNDNDMIVQLDHPTNGQVDVVRMPFTLSDTPFPIRSSSPILGEHTEDILSRLGISPEVIKQVSKNSKD